MSAFTPTSEDFATARLMKVSKGCDRRRSCLCSPVVQMKLRRKIRHRHKACHKSRRWTIKRFRLPDPDRAWGGEFHFGFHFGSIHFANQTPWGDRGAVAPPPSAPSGKPDEERSHHVIDDATDLTKVKEALKHLEPHMPGQEPALYLFAAELGERLNPEMLPVGVNLTVELLLHDLRVGVSGYAHGHGRPLPRDLVGNPSIFYVLLSMSVPQILRAVFPADFAEAVMKVRAEVAAEVKAELKASRPPRPPPVVEAPLSAEEETATYAAARRIADIWDECVRDEAEACAGTEDVISWSDHRGERANGFCDRTAHGLYLEWYYGGPAQIWTPWGGWRFGGGLTTCGRTAERAVERLRKRVELRLHSEVVHDEQGTFGPVYAVVGIRDWEQAIPEARLADQRSNVGLYEQNVDTWKRLTDAWNQRREAKA